MPATPTTTWSNVQSIGQVWQTTLLLGLSMLLPFVFHLIPSYDDAAWGPRLLPIFYAPIIAALLYRPHVSFLLAVAPPWLNHLLTGRPPEPMAMQLTLELMVFTVLARGLTSSRLPSWLVGPLAYLLGKPVMIVLLLIASGLPAHAAPGDWAIRSTFVALPGIVVLGVLSYGAGRIARERAGSGKR